MKANEIKGQLFWLEESVGNTFQKEMIGNVYALINKYEEEILRLRKVIWDSDNQKFKAIESLGGSNSGGLLVGRMIIENAYLTGKDIFEGDVDIKPLKRTLSPKGI